MTEQVGSPMLAASGNAVCEVARQQDCVIASPGEACGREDFVALVLLD
ncbi:MAG: hypothetical protein ACUVRZ_09180 [Desulfobacca sp.]